MDIPATRFPSELVKIIEEVADSHLIAFDLEFSGVAGRRNPDIGKLTLQQYYEDTKAAAHKYQILQLGLTVVSEDITTATYTAYPYNFNISPVPLLRERILNREWSYQSGAVSFLTRHGFIFDTPITQGIWYLSRKEEHQARAALLAEDEKNLRLADMELKSEDDALVSHIRTAVQKWQSRPKTAQEAFLNVPDHETPGAPETLNRYQVRLTHQIVRNDFPNLKTTGMGYFVQVTNPTAEQQASQKVLQEQERERKIAVNVGFRWLIEAIVAGDISKLPIEYILNGKTVLKDGMKPTEYLKHLQQRLRSRRRVLVGHNCFTDLVYLYACFIGDLPPTVEEFQININEMFPAVIDTKYLASHRDKKWSDTSLEAVHVDMNLESKPKINIAEGYDKYAVPNAYHEAGFDALVTAKAAIKLSAKIEREAKYLTEVQAPSVARPDEFGLADEDGYVTADETEVNKKHNNKQSFSSGQDDATTDATKLKSFFSNIYGSTTVGSRQESTAGPPSSPMSSVEPVREQNTAPAKSVSDQVEKVRMNFGKINIYDVLNGEDGMNENGSTRPGSEPATLDAKKIDALVKEGELMPRWNGENNFWQIFGNKLQVNGSKEGVCKF